MAKHIYHFLDTVGDGSGTYQAIGDYSGTPTSFKFIGDGSDRTASINRMIVLIGDSGAFDSDKYGNGIALTNGIKLHLRAVSDDAIIETFTPKPIKTNTEWGGVCYDFKVINEGIGDDFGVVRWTFGNSGYPIKVVPGETYLSLDLEDNFSGLTAHTFVIEGYYY